MRVIFKEVLERLGSCPVCFSPLESKEVRDGPNVIITVRECVRGRCGDFRITAVHGDGTVDLTFKMNPWD